MTKVIIAFDDNDTELGDYFEESFNAINASLSVIDGVFITPIRGLECSEESIISKIDSSQVVFVGLSHGNEEQLLTENDVFVDCENIAHFNKSLFYTPACSTALILGNKLIEEGCASFVGCNKDTFATYEDSNSVYIECENHCLIDFFNSDNTIEESFNNMLFFYDKQIDLLFDKCDDVLLAMELQHNKDSFVLYGNKSLKKTDFEVKL